MKTARGLRTLAMILAYVNVAFNLLAGLSLIAGIWLVAALCWTFVMISGRRRAQMTTHRHEWPMRRSSISAAPPRSIIVLEPGERVIPLPDGWKRTQTPNGTRYIRECSHWPRDEVKLNDGTTVAYICRRCGHDWADEQWVRTP